MARFVLSFILVSMLIIAILAKIPKSKSTRNADKYMKSVRDLPRPKSYARQQTGKTQVKYAPSIKSYQKRAEKYQGSTCAQNAKVPKEKIEECVAETKIAAYEVETKETEPELSAEMYCSKCCSSCHCSSEFPVININTYPPNYVPSEEKVTNDESEAETQENEENEVADEQTETVDGETSESNACTSEKNC